MIKVGLDSNVGGLLLGGCASQHCIACSADPGAQADTAATGVAVSTTLNQGSVVDHAYQQGTAATGLRTSHVWGTLSMCAAYRLCMQPAGPLVKTQDVTVDMQGTTSMMYTHTLDIIFENIGKYVVRDTYRRVSKFAVEYFCSNDNQHKTI